MRFMEYKRSKEKQRASFYRPTSKKTKFGNQDQDSDVTINIGLMKTDEEGNLKPVRGKVLPLKVKKSTNAKDLCEFATKKQQAHNSIGSGPFKLVYPNGSEVKQLTESKNGFSVAKYKAEIGRPYQRLTLYLCNSMVLIESLMSFDSCESDIEDNSDHSEELGTSTIPESSKQTSCLYFTTSQPNDTSTDSTVTLTVDLSASDFIDTEPIDTENEGNSENVILGIGEIKTQLDTATASSSCFQDFSDSSLNFSSPSYPSTSRKTHIIPSLKG